MLETKTLSENTAALPKTSAVFLPLEPSWNLPQNSPQSLTFPELTTLLGKGFDNHLVGLPAKILQKGKLLVFWWRSKVSKMFSHQSPSSTSALESLKKRTLLARSEAKTLGNLKVHGLNKIIFENENCGKKRQRKKISGREDWQRLATFLKDPLSLAKNQCTPKYRLPDRSLHSH